MQFKAIKARRPVIGQLVRNKGDGRRISRVVAVEGKYVWLRGCADTKGRTYQGRVTRHEWQYFGVGTYRCHTLADSERWHTVVENWRAAGHPLPAPKHTSTGAKYTTGGQWETGWYRPVQQVA